MLSYDYQVQARHARQVRARKAKAAEAATWKSLSSGFATLCKLSLCFLACCYIFAGHDVDEEAHRGLLLCPNEFCQSYMGDESDLSAGIRIDCQSKYCDTYRILCLKCRDPDFVEGEACKKCSNVDVSAKVVETDVVLKSDAKIDLSPWSHKQDLRSACMPNGDYNFNAVTIRNGEHLPTEDILFYSNRLKRWNLCKIIGWKSTDGRYACSVRVQYHTTGRTEWVPLLVVNKKTGRNNRNPQLVLLETAWNEEDDCFVLSKTSMGRQWRRAKNVVQSMQTEKGKIRIKYVASDFRGDEYGYILKGSDPLNARDVTTGKKT